MAVFIIAVFLGILAGVCPCGIIVLLAELFRAESKSQVYANVHKLLRKYLCISSNLGRGYITDMYM